MLIFEIDLSTRSHFNLYYTTFAACESDINPTPPARTDEVIWFFIGCFGSCVHSAELWIFFECSHN